MAVELGGNPPSSNAILRTGKAVSEQRVGPWRTRRQIQPASERSAVAAGEGHSLGRSCHLVESDRRALDEDPALRGSAYTLLPDGRPLSKSGCETSASSQKFL